MTHPEKALTPRAETKKKMRPLTRDAFGKILNKSITTPSAKPLPKST